MRSSSCCLFLVVAMFVRVLAGTSTASAQDVALSEAAPSETTQTDPELSAIELEQHFATALYVTSLTTHLTGLALWIGFLSAYSSCTLCGSTSSDLTWGIIGGLMTAGVGVLLVVPAIALDVDAHNRRDDWQARTWRGPAASLRVGPGGVAVYGTF